ncbi:MAG: hypothetical protein GDA52_09960 [Rhodobacteraceae bacterium]|nr:hypothetical protein [Paracoccaceae bacterium]
MTVAFALFLSPDGIALAHRQDAGHWALIGNTALDVPDLSRALAKLREAGEVRGGVNFETLLILPDDQILYTELADVAESSGIPIRLEGLTPYAVEDLAWDWRDLGGGRIALAAVARETLDEAEAFARNAGFNGVGLAAAPPVQTFPGVPLFQLAGEAGDIHLPETGITFGPDTWTAPEPDTRPLIEVVPDEVSTKGIDDAEAANKAATPDHDASRVGSADQGRVPADLTAGVPAADLPVISGIPTKRASAGTSPSFRIGLIVTLILILILTMIAIWAALFLPDSGTVTRWLDRESPDVEITTVPGGAPVLSEPEWDSLARPGPVAAAPAPEVRPDPPKVATTLPDIHAVDPERPLPSPEQAEAEYTAGEFWQYPSEHLASVAPDIEEDNIRIAAIDEGAHPLASLQHQVPPPPFGMASTPEPDEARVFHDSPPVPSAPYEGGAADQAEVHDDAARNTPIVAEPVLWPESMDEHQRRQFPDGITMAEIVAEPVLRPENMDEQRQLPDGFTMAEHASRRPTIRPPSVQRLALAAWATGETADGADNDTPLGAGFDAAASGGTAVAEVSFMAVDSSHVPRVRPSGFTRIVAHATASAPGAGSGDAPAVAQPSIPSNATVSRAATRHTTLNLRRVNLVGVINTPSDRRALLRLPSGEFVPVRVGDHIDGGQVAVIGEDSLQYVKNGRNITLNIPG